MAPEYTFIDTEEAFQAFASETPRLFGFDTEFTRERTFNPIPELLQIALENHIAIIDLRADLNIERIKHWFQQDGIVRVAHSISNDIEVLNEVFQDEVGVIEDSQLALAFMHAGQMQSYAKLVKRQFGVTLDKTMQRSRWDERPLSRGQLDYAALDIAHLNELWCVLVKQLQESDRLDWYLEERNRLQKPDADDPNRIVGNARRLMRLSERGLQFLISLDTWRTKRASSMDIPKNWVLTRDQLFQLASERSLKDQALRKVLSSKQVDRHRRKLRELHRHAQVAAQRSELTPPQRLRKVVQTLGEQCNTVANQMNVSEEVLGSNKDLLFAIRAYLRDGELPSWFGTWRTELIGNATKRAADEFAREIAITK
ncbi:MAG: HRDC domain-containing protein [Gammaproteobacteria bacterium]|nr:HRDC domain-containing protein [Gammaproteobacteria bacterium]